ncbi:MAG: hypothetical protein COT71_02445 [Candidatus Andersenbacteria bacterium CG10_big_fil_rev_8_21_14_0_10_54_11]|uniref:Uncharacterized protein n=1 Tax=Candidatus Andersenbacteria bacterium CG10_big_fil_rev_8_21_14_0_10_54_11 TaxID=1974485 RepID=A0A2M6WZA3_9BACT|nr:MAG: hypothetical protein COT71_02445 [Candidatus Andersenbacteria bacterium CG10_big_fil_rev_8_21_14_0_10_54_11]
MHTTQTNKKDTETKTRPHGVSNALSNLCSGQSLRPGVRSVSYLCSLIAACIVFLPSAAYAIDPVPAPSGLPSGVSGNTKVVPTLLRLINIFLGIIAIIAVIVIIIAGFRLIISGGDEESARAARRQILYAIIGLVVIILSVVVVNFIISLFPA